MALPEVPLQNRRKLDSRELAGPESVGTVRHLADPIRARFVEIALGDVGRIEVDHRSSRSSDWYTAESTGTFDRLPIATSRLGSGRPVTDGSKG